MIDLPLLVLLIPFTVLLSAFFSGTEIAFVTANRVRLEVLQRRRVFGATLASYFVRHIDKTLITTLVGNNAAHALYATLMTVALGQGFGIRDAVAQMAIATLVILFFGEVVPRLLLRETADAAVLLLAPVLWLLRGLFYPVILISEGLSLGIVRLFGSSETSIEQFFRKQDFEMLLRENTPAGSAAAKDAEIISNVFVLKDIRVRESMVPRTEIEGIEKNAPMKEVYRRFAESGYSKLVVYDESIDNVVGVAGVYDLFTKPKSLESIIGKVTFVPETKRSAELLREFVESGESVAIVVDEFGGTAGLVTAEDLIEELVGDIQDEFDNDEDVCRALSDDTFLISGRIEIDTINEKFHLALPKENYETLAGFILSGIGRIPKQGEVVKIESYTLTISKATKTRIDVVKLQVARQIESMS